AHLQILLIEDAFGQAAEEARHIAFKRLPARTEPPRARGQHLPYLLHTVLVSARSVQQQQRRLLPGPTGNILMDKVQRVGIRSHFGSSPPGKRIGGTLCSMRSRCDSYIGGSIRRVPNRSGVSSMAKPGGSVAISNRTPPGSRK